MGDSAGTEGAANGVPEPVFSGSLRSNSLAQVCIALYRRRFSGTLAVWPDDDRPGQDKVLFRKGAPVSARLLDPSVNVDQGLLALFARRRAPYACYECDLVMEKGKALDRSLDTLILVSRAVREHFPSEFAERMLARCSDATQRVRRGAPVDRLDLNSQEEGFIDYARAQPKTVADLIDDFYDESLATRMVFLLLITSCLEPYTDETRKLHGSVLPRARSSLRPAPRVGIAGPSLRPAPRVGTARPPTMTQSPLQKARKLSESKQWDDAIAELDAAIESGQEDAEHLTEKAWALFQKHGTDDQEHAREIRSLLAEASRKDPYHSHTFYVSGKYYRAVGNEKKAIACFRKAAKLDPHHIKAAREVNLSNVRKSIESRSSLFARLKR